MTLRIKMPYLSFGTVLTIVESYCVAWVLLVISVIASCTEWFPVFQCVDVSWGLVGWTALGLSTIIYLIRHPEW